MKKLLIIICTTTTNAAAIACPACEAQQPPLLRGIVHGRGPETAWDLAILSLALVIFLLTLVYSIKYLVRPGETSDGHIKHFILNDE